MVVIWCYQRTAQVLGGLRSTLMLAGHFQRTEAVVINNRGGDFAALAEALSVRNLVIPAEVDVSNFRGSSWNGKMRTAVGVLQLQWTVVRQLRRLGGRILHVDYEGWWLLVPLARLSGYKVVHYLRCEPRRLGWKTWISLLLSTRNIFIAQGLREWMYEKAPRMAQARLRQNSVTIRNSLDFAGIDRHMGERTVTAARADLGLTEADAVYVAMVGTVCERKGQLEFLRDVGPSILRVSGLRLLIIGDSSPPEWEGRCRRLAEELGISDGVRFVPFSMEVYDWYLGIDILAHYASAEGIPRVTLEAQAFGRPVVARRIIGIDEAVEEGETGFIAGSAAEMAERIVQLATQPELRARMGGAGAVRVRQRFSPELAAGRLEAVYAEITGNGSAERNG